MKLQITMGPEVKLTGYYKAGAKGPDSCQGEGSGVAVGGGGQGRAEMGGGGGEQPVLAGQIIYTLG